MALTCNLAGDMAARASLLFLLCLICMGAGAQVIHGEVLDMEGKGKLPGVNIVNVYTAFAVTTGADGDFLIPAASDQLLEFQKAGYRTVRFRIPKGSVPPYFRIMMQRGFTAAKDLGQGNRYTYHDDSLRFYNIYRHELDFPKLSAIGSIQHPFSALSGRNREIWQFQDDYKMYEQEKYIDRTFNEALVAKLTGLSGDSARTYMRRYRPTYDQLRSMSDYAFFNFIKMSVHSYRHSRDTPRRSQ